MIIMSGIITTAGIMGGATTAGMPMPGTMVHRTTAVGDTAVTVAAGIQAAGDIPDAAGTGDIEPRLPAARVFSGSKRIKVEFRR